LDPESGVIVTITLTWALAVFIAANLLPGIVTVAVLTATPYNSLLA